MEASKRVRVSEGFICHLLVLSALPSYKHANRHGIPDKKRVATEYSAEPHVRISAATLDAWRQIPKKESTTSIRLDTHVMCEAFLPNAVRIHP
jgi:hypothetical protein